MKGLSLWRQRSVFSVNRPICLSSGSISGTQTKRVSLVGKANLGNVVTPIPSSSTENNEVIFSTEYKACSQCSQGWDPECTSTIANKWLFEEHLPFNALWVFSNWVIKQMTPIGSDNNGVKEIPPSSTCDGFPSARSTSPEYNHVQLLLHYHRLNSPQHSDTFHKNAPKARD